MLVFLPIYILLAAWRHIGKLTKLETIKQRLWLIYFIWLYYYFSLLLVFSMRSSAFSQQIWPYMLSCFLRYFPMLQRFYRFIYFPYPASQLRWGHVKEWQRKRSGGRIEKRGEDIRQERHWKEDWLWKKRARRHFSRSVFQYFRIGL